MGKTFWNVLHRHRSAAIGVALGIALGAGVAGATMQGFDLPGTQYDGAHLIRTQNLTPVATPPNGAPMSFADMIERVSPAVVSIETKGKVKLDEMMIPGFMLPPQGNREQEVRGAGSGFFISADGYIVTNNHVIDGADEIIVKMTDDKELKATVVGRDAATDLAVLKVDGKNFPFVTFELEHRPRVGDWVVAVGNPFGFAGTATAGIVSAYGRNLAGGGGPNYIDYLQIDAAINRGNSGGPTFDIYGRVIGVNTAIISPNGANAGVGFAIPASEAHKITSQLMTGQAVARGYIGVTIQTLTKETAEALNITDLDGAYVTETARGGPSEKAGIQAGDIIKSVNGQNIKTSTELTRRVADVKAGEQVKVTVLRNGKMVNLTITAALRPSEDDLAKMQQGGGSAPSPADPAAPAKPEVMGLEVAPITPENRQSYGIAVGINGVVITSVNGSSDAAEKGLKAGDVIVRADNRAVTSYEEFSAIVTELTKANRPSILLLINRAGRNVPLPVSLKPATTPAP